VKPDLAGDAVQPPGEPSGRDHAQAPGWVELVAQVVAERHEIDEMVGVEVADHHPGEVRGLQTAGQPGERARAQVKA
jgi:hypothetical protein